MYPAWLYYGEYLAFGALGVLLTLARRILFGKFCQEAALGSRGTGRMLKAMTLKYEKSNELNVGIRDIPVFVQKYLCQEKRLGVSLGQWRRLPERWTGLILAAGFLESAAFWYLKHDAMLCLNRFLAAVTAAAAVYLAALLLEADSLWERACVYLLDYVSNTLCPRQTHEYEGFKEEEAEAADAEATEWNQADESAEAKQPPKPARIQLEKEEERIFQEVLSDFLGSST